MAPYLHDLITQYGYLAVALGCFFEGEVALLLGIVAANNGLLSIPGVIGVAIISTIVGDNLWFHVGRRLGRPALDKRPGWRPKAARVEKLLERYGDPLMVGFRFLYALRYITPFVLGSLNISPWRFLALEALGAVIWANIIAWTGVALADALESALTRITNIEQLLAVAVVVLILVGYIIYRWRRRRYRSME